MGFGGALLGCLADAFVADKFGKRTAIATGIAASKAVRITISIGAVGDILQCLLLFLVPISRQEIMARRCSIGVYGQARRSKRIHDHLAGSKMVEGRVIL